MKLLDQVRDVIRKKHYSIRTEQAYADWIRRFILFHNKQHPKDMREREIAQYISHLATDSNVAAITSVKIPYSALFRKRRVRPILQNM